MDFIETISAVADRFRGGQNETALVSIAEFQVIKAEIMRLQESNNQYREAFKRIGESR